MSHITEPEPKVLVIGAGIAGLACASSLRRAGIDVQVLEARDRVGGRLWTLRDLADGRPIEAGAMMVHGRRASLHRWVTEFGLRTRRVPILRGGRFYNNGRLRGTLAMGLGGLSGIRTALQSLLFLPRAIERYRGPDMTLADFLARRRATPLAALLVGNMYANVNATDPGELSVRGLAEEANAGSLGLPWTNYQVLEGMETIATRRAAELEGRIRFRTRVDRMAWSKGGVTAEAESPSGRETFLAGAAVITVPLGVLKAGGIVFEPLLPETKRRAIDAIGYGDANKILLVFDESLRRTPLGRSVFLTDSDGSWFFLPYHGVRGVPIIVEGFLGGRTARRLSGRPEADTVDEILHSLERMIPGVDLRTHLRAARFIDWTSDPYSRGGYCFPAIGGGQAARTALAEPLDDVLFFAGEATDHEGHHATADGALDTGERAAREVLRSLRAPLPLPSNA